MNRFLAVIATNIRERADSPFCFFVDRGETRIVSWADLGESIATFAALYRWRNLEPGGVVPIFLRHHPALYPSFFGAMFAGLVPSFMPCPSARQDPPIFWESHRKLLRHIEPAAIVLDRDTDAEMRAAGLLIAEERRIFIDERAPAEAMPIAVPGEDAVALLQHSSGTTGLKKGVALSYRAIAEQLQSYGHAIAIEAEDRIVSWLPLYHDMGLVACLLLPAYYGVPFIQLDPFLWAIEPQRFFEAIAAHRGTLAWLPNFAFDHLAGRVGEESRIDLSRMRAFINCSEICRPQSFDRFRRRFGPWGLRTEALQSCYAMAETVFAVTQTPLAAPPRDLMIVPPAHRIGESIIPCPQHRDGALQVMNLGKPIAGIEASIRDDRGNPLPDFHLGEIALRGEFLLDEYYRDPALTAERMRDGWYLSRDLGFMAAGEVYVLGRRDDLLIVNGRNLHAREIEAIIDKTGLTKPGRSVAFALYDEALTSNGLVVVAERSETCALDDDAIIFAIVERIRSILDIAPREILLAPPGWIVKTTSGKISRGDNLRKYFARQRGAAEPALA